MRNNRFMSVLALISASMLSGACTSPPRSQTSNASSAMKVLPVAPKLTPGAWLHEYSDLEADPSVIWGRLDNGMRFAIAPNIDASDGVSLRLLVHAGSLMEDDDQRGLAHLLEHLAFEGSRHFPKGQLVARFQRRGVSYGPGLNATTSPESTVYKLDLPDNSPDGITLGLSAFRDVVDGLMLDPAEVESERLVVLSEMRDTNTAERRYSAAWRAFVFPGSRLVDRPAIGSPDVVRHAPRRRILDFYRDFYTPSRTVLVVAGDVFPETIKSIVDEMFGSWRSSSARSDPSPGPLAPARLRVGTHLDPVLSRQLEFVWVVPWQQRLDSEAWRRRDLFLKLGFGILQSRLDESARSSGAFTKPRVLVSREAGLGEAWSVRVIVSKQRWVDAAFVLSREVHRALQFGFEKSELEKEIEYLRTRFRDRFEQAPTRQASAVVRRIVISVVDERVFTHPRDELSFFERATVGVSEDVISNVFHSIAGDREPAIFRSGDVSSRKTEEATVTAYRDATRRKLDAPHTLAQGKGEAKSVFGSIEPAPLPEFRRTTSGLGRDRDLTVTQAELANGVFVNLMPTPYENDTVRVAVRFGRGTLSVPSSLEGIDWIASRVFVSGGVEGHSYRELRAALDEKETSIDLHVDLDAFRLAGVTSPADLGVQLQLLARYVSSAAFDLDDLDRVKERHKRDLRRFGLTPQGVIWKQVRRLVRGGDHRFGLPEGEPIETRTVDELEKWMRPQLERGPLEVSIVGDFELEETLKSVAAVFGALPKRLPRAPLPPDSDEMRFVREATHYTFPHGGPKDQSLALKYWRTPGRKELDAEAALSLIVDIIENRLLETIREADGQTYNPDVNFANYNAFPNFGLLRVRVPCHPRRSAAVLQRIEGVVEDLRASGVEGDELQRARLPHIARSERLLADNQRWLRHALFGSSEKPERVRRSMDFIAALARIQASSLNETVRNYLDRTKSVSVVIEPSGFSENQSVAATAGRPASRFSEVAAGAD